MDIEGNMGPLSELEELPPQIDGAFPPKKNSFSVGATLGRVVHGFTSLRRWIVRTVLGLHRSDTIHSTTQPHRRRAG